MSSWYNKQVRKIVLASLSPRRKQLLKQIGLEISVDPSLIEEELNPRLKPRGQVEVLSLQKAISVGKKYPDAIIIAADTLVAVDDQVMGKPSDLQEAKRMLKRLSERQHSIVTGVTIYDTKNKKKSTKSVETKVWFKRLSQREIDEYVKKEKVLDKAGGYAIQGLGAVFVERIEGDFFGSVGLPLNIVYSELRKVGVDVLENQNDEYWKKREE